MILWYELRQVGMNGDCFVWMAICCMYNEKLAWMTIGFMNGDRFQWFAKSLYE